MTTSTTKTQYVVARGRLYTLKAGVTLDEIKTKHPDWQIVKGKKPGMGTLEKWVSNGIAKAIDGCLVESDGTCPHGCQSWLLVLGYV